MRIRTEYALSVLRIRANTVYFPKDRLVDLPPGIVRIRTNTEYFRCFYSRKREAAGTGAGETAGGGTGGTARVGARATEF